MMTRHTLKIWLTQLAVATAYVLLAKLTLSYFSTNGAVSIIWPSGGMALAAVLLGGKRYAIGILIGAIIQNKLTGIGYAESTIIAFSSMLEALLAAWLLKKDSTFSLEFESLNDFGRLTVYAGFVACFISAFTGASTLYLSGYLDADSYLLNLLQWWQGDVLGIILFTPLILVWRRLPDLSSRNANLESIIVFLLAFLIGQIIFLSWFSSIFVLFAKAYLMFLVITWVALRYGNHGTLALLCMVAIQGLISAFNHIGYFAEDIDESHLLRYWIYMVTLSLVGMTLSTYLSARKKLEQDLSVSHHSLDQTRDAIFRMDRNARIVYVNQAACQHLGYDKEELLQLSIPDIDPDYSIEVWNDHWDNVKRMGAIKFETRHLKKDKSILQVEIVTSFINTFAGEFLFASVRDVTERKKAEHEIETLAFFDTLTGLPNRRLLIDRLSIALSVASRSKQYGALIFLDLDRFKTLNDMLGHDYGDLLLIEVANRLKQFMRETDTVARFGGDEFVVLIEKLGEDEQDALKSVSLISEKIRSIINTSYQLKEITHHSSPSIGVCLFCEDAISVEELIKRADIAMYQSKESGRNQVRFFDPQLQRQVEERASLESDLRAAITHQQFQLFYQVQVDHNQRPIGAEALIRWHHPSRGMVPPVQFISIAEDSSLILEISEWVLNTACQQLAQWANNQQTRHLVLAINISAHQFRQADFVEKIASKVHEYNIKASKLKLELTESVALEDIEMVVAKMKALRENLGVSISLDDFGTGYSSLSYLTRLPLNQIKIDQSFVRDMNTDASDAVMVKTIIDLANNFGLEVIAEGVETDQHLAFLRQYGCKAFQGYFFSKPIPIDQFEKLLSTF